jgi:hypothetical protein
MRLAFLCMFVLDANMGAMARPPSAKARARGRHRARDGAREGVASFRLRPPSAMGGDGRVSVRSQLG